MLCRFKITPAGIETTAPDEADFLMSMEFNLGILQAGVTGYRGNPKENGGGAMEIKSVDKTNLQIIAQLLENRGFRKV